MLKAITISACLSGAICAGGAGLLTYRYEEGRRALDRVANVRAQVEAQIDARELQKKQDDTSMAAALAEAKTHERIEIQTRTLIQKVPVYVSAKVDHDFPLPCGFSRLHNAAAEGRDPADVSYPAGQPDGATCPVKISDALTVITYNYGVARQTREQLIGLQGWVINEQSISQRVP